MAKRLPINNANGEVRELTKVDLNFIKKDDQVLPKSMADNLPKRGRPVSAKTQKTVTSDSRRKSYQPSNRPDVAGKPVSTRHFATGPRPTLPACERRDILPGVLRKSSHALQWWRTPSLQKSKTPSGV